MSITTGYQTQSGQDLGNIFAVSPGGSQITKYVNSAGTDLGALFLINLEALQ
jgi:hypothetical protein